MSALLQSAPLLLRRRGALADILPVIAFTAATAITATVVGGAAAFVGRLPEGSTPMTGEASIMGFLVLCAITASVLLVPSAVGLGGSAARLSLARREKDLATMRLVGGTSGQVGSSRSSTWSRQSLLGAVLGLGAHVAVTPALTGLDFGITPFTVADLLMPWWAYLVLVVALVLIAAGSAAVALTGVVLSPLGVARDSRVVRMSVIRVVLWAVLIIGFVGFMQVGTTLMGQSGGGGAAIAVMVLFIAAIVAGTQRGGPLHRVGHRAAAGEDRADPVAHGGRPAARRGPASGLASRLGHHVRSGDRRVPHDDRGLGRRARTRTRSMMNTAMSTGGLLTLGIAAVLAAVSTGVTQTARRHRPGPAPARPAHRRRRGGPAAPGTAGRDRRARGAQLDPRHRHRPAGDLTTVIGGAPKDRDDGRRNTWQRGRRLCGRDRCRARGAAARVKRYARRAA